MPSASLSGQSYVVAAQGSDANGSLTFAASLTFNSDGSTSGTADFNDIVNQFSGTAAAAGPYTVDATGRVTVTGLIVKDSVTSNLYGPITLQLYLDGAGNATAVSMDKSDSFAGPAFQQTASASLAGNYALNAYGISGYDRGSLERRRPSFHQRKRYHRLQLPQSNKPNSRCHSVGNDR